MYGWNKGIARYLVGRVFLSLKNILKNLILISLSILFLSSAQASPIWRIGYENENEPKNEFFPSPLDQAIVNYIVPDNWRDPNVDWTLFPHILNPPEREFPPEEIHINYDYDRYLKCPVLRIKALSQQNNFGQKLIVFKGVERKPIDEKVLTSSFSLYEFYLGPMRRGLLDENKIIIKNHSLNDKSRPIYFDYIELDDQDQDGDGSLDSEEFEGNTDESDTDNLEDSLDPDTGSILIKSYDQSITKRIILDIEEKGDAGQYFQELSLLDQNFPVFLTGLPGEIFFPYGLFRIKIHISGEEEEIPLRMIYPEKLYPSAQFYLYDESGGWQKLPLRIGDEKSLSITLKPGEAPNGQEEKQVMASRDSGVITLIGGLAYPREIDFTLEEKGCFISSLFFLSRH